jgi:hypothetical protein
MKPASGGQKYMRALMATRSVDLVKPKPEPKPLNCLLAEKLAIALSRIDAVKQTPDQFSVSR